MKINPILEDIAYIMEETNTSRDFVTEELEKHNVSFKSGLNP